MEHGGGCLREDPSDSRVEAARQAKENRATLRPIALIYRKSRVSEEFEASARTNGAGNEKTKTFGLSHRRRGSAVG
jgi:hypothetical protein